MNYYRTSTGERISKSIVDANIRKAKQEKLSKFLQDNGYYYCEDCKRNDCKPIDCSHDISVKECQENGMTELAWDVNNITLRGRACHRKHDKS